ncbi:type III pantothenate kinase [Thermovibrio guaymasensis]|uniref:Type III pantothenate kinase n=1 Tax=Thermovibrio guaymasensis TaxID=240167 RepID=A0A420W7V2_9BACT|nr:type III pantothenate kinase [Thermovibrio guaymasensis]RKQ63397.1 type III pantothenate kinase [Thermovibrio guaymasensis]
MQSTEPKLLIDAGNSTVKVGVFKRGRVELVRRVPTEEILKDPKLLKELSGKFKGEVGIASVVPEVSELIREFFPDSKFVKLERELPVKIHYVGEMGPDRIANILGGSTFFKSFIVASFGTATVVDVVINCEFKGGIILPGLKLMARALKEGTALLPEVKSFKSSKLGMKTRECIESGILRGTYGAVLSVKREFPGVPLILTGGYSRLIERLLNGILVEELTLLGIANFLSYKGGMKSPR